MTAKQKAEELYKKYNIPQITEFSKKQCILIALNEILNISAKYAGKDYEFYLKVKEEIDKL